MPLDWNQTATRPPHDEYMAFHEQLRLFVKGPIQMPDGEVWEWHIKGPMVGVLVRSQAPSEEEAKRQAEKQVSRWQKP